MLQLNPPLWMHTPKGKALAVMVIDYGQLADLYWVTFGKESGECWTWRNADVRIEPSITDGIGAAR